MLVHPSRTYNAVNKAQVQAAAGICIFQGTPIYVKLWSLQQIARILQLRDRVGMLTLFAHAEIAQVRPLGISNSSNERTKDCMLAKALDVGVPVNRSREVKNIDRMYTSR